MVGRPRGGINRRPNILGRPRLPYTIASVTQEYPTG
jgi:hypothetical protein